MKPKSEAMFEMVPAGYGTPCWLWLRRVNNKGYGEINRIGYERLAHRYVYSLANGPIPSGLSLDHLCRNTRCVRPDHLEPVTHATNIRRGRHVKLSIEKVEEFRQRYAAGGVTMKQLALEIGIDPSNVVRALSGKQWTQSNHPKENADD